MNRKNRAYNQFQTRDSDSERFDGRKFNKRAKDKNQDPALIELQAREQWEQELR